MPITSPKTVILSAPPGWGKTQNAAFLRGVHGCRALVDPWAPGQPVQRGALHLTNCPPAACVGLGAQVVAEGWTAAGVQP